jgi:Tol biopolymer transport system component
MRRQAVRNCGRMRSRAASRLAPAAVGIALLAYAPAAQGGATGGLADPGYSPNGKRIVYTDLRGGGDREIVTISAKGKHRKRLTKNDATDVNPVYTPSGRRILFASDRGPEDDFDIYSMKTDGSKVHPITDNEVIDDFDPSPAGKRIALSSTADGDYEIWTMKADGSDMVPLTINTDSDYIPFFSADGSQIAFVSDRDGNNNIYAMNGNGGDQTPLTDNSSPDSDPAMSPNGKRVAFESNRDGDAEIFLTEPANQPGDEIQLTVNPGDFDGDPSFSPDSKKILFVGFGDSAYQLFRMDLDGTHRHQITHF